MHRRFLCLYFPNWPIEATLKNLQCKPPLILTSQRAGQTVVKACSDEARECDVRTGMSAGMAKALCSKALFHPFEAEVYFKMLYKISLWAFRFTPLVAIERELVQAYRKGSLEEIDPRFYGLVLDITGTARVHRGEVALLQRILFKAEKAGLSLQAAIASSIGCAWALARYGEYSSREVVRLSQQQRMAFISSLTGARIVESCVDLPLPALRIPTETIQSLEELGIYTIGQLQDLPRNKLPSRFGAKLLSQLDQLTGAAEEPLLLIHPSKHIAVNREFDPPLMVHKAVQRAVLSLVAQILEELTRKQKRAAKFILIIQGVDPRRSVSEASFLIKKEFSLHNASSDLSHISSAISPFFETLKIPEGVSQVSLTARCTENQGAEQQSSEESSPACISEQQQDEFLNNTILQLGRKRVSQVVFHESHTPEKSFSFLPLDLVEKSEESTSRRHFRYPSYILKFPQRISALSLLPDAPPTRITWQGQQLDILQGFGPERIAEEWWQEQLKEIQEEREYFRVQDQNGRWLWVFRSTSSMEWFLHGVWG